ncbi:MAG: M3 family metallopeptidase, partial [bacterium]
MPEITEQLPRWNMANVYPSINSGEFESDFEKVTKELNKLDEYFKKHGIDKLEKVPDDLKAVGAILSELIGIFNDVIETYSTLESYIYAFYTTNSYDTAAARKFSELEQVGILRKKIFTKFEAWMGSLGPKLEEIYKLTPAVKEYKPTMDYIAEQAKYMMDTKLEDLATELAMSGGGVMWKLQGTVTSQLKMPFERDGVTEELPMTVIRNLANNPDEDVRKRAYETELKGWEKIRESIAFSLNGVKGSAITLAKWRGREDVLHESIDRDKMDRETLNALRWAMKDSFPMFRKYHKRKAKQLGKSKLAWWDLFAPVGVTKLRYSWDEAAEFVVEQFNGFSKELGDFAKNAFDENWIDAGP